MKLRSNTILITGGASGIGYELTKQLTALGNTILITGRDQAKMDLRKRTFRKFIPFEATVPIRKRSLLFTKISPNNFLRSTF
ncbi:MAG TPA: SDR family NAD(P)-dependent oxidoreductase [Bryobacteraceae bacterium]|nr:SDR family NAD(P)-dependent oxidoreductase [Bryobacteraceae bacterium]